TKTVMPMPLATVAKTWAYRSLVAMKTAAATAITIATASHQGKSAFEEDEGGVGIRRRWRCKGHERSASSHPPLACRPSPPQVGRLAVSVSPPILQRRRLAKAEVTSDLPP